MSDYLYIGDRVVDLTTYSIDDLEQLRSELEDAIRTVDEYEDKLADCES